MLLYYIMSDRFHLLVPNTQHTVKRWRNSTRYSEVDRGFLVALMNIISQDFINICRFFFNWHLRKNWFQGFQSFICSILEIMWPSRWKLLIFCDSLLTNVPVLWADLLCQFMFFVKNVDGSPGFAASLADYIQGCCQSGYPYWKVCIFVVCWRCSTWYSPNLSLQGFRKYNLKTNETRWTQSDLSQTPLSLLLPKKKKNQDKNIIQPFLDLIWTFISIT